MGLRRSPEARANSYLWVAGIYRVYLELTPSMKESYFKKMLNKQWGGVWKLIVALKKNKVRTFPLLGYTCLAYGSGNSGFVLGSPFPILPLYLTWFWKLIRVTSLTVSMSSFHSMFYLLNQILSFFRAWAVLYSSDGSGTAQAQCLACGGDSIQCLAGWRALVSWSCSNLGSIWGSNFLNWERRAKELWSGINHCSSHSFLQANGKCLLYARPSWELHLHFHIYYSQQLYNIGTVVIVTKKHNSEYH